MSEPFLGEIRMFGGNFAPRGWAFCDGQLLPIAQNTALFSLLGTTYGGDGQSTFGLPDLRGRFPMHEGQGPGLTPRSLGAVAGAEAVTLIASQMPAHNHTVGASTGEANDVIPTNGYLAAGNQYSASANTSLNPAALGVAGGSQPHDNMPPYLVVNFIIALEGIYPSRN